MAKVRGRGNASTELVLVSLFRANRVVGWRRHAKLPGRPDFIFRALRLAIFVDGDFWHGNPARYKTPKTNPSFWDLKIETNRARDRRVDRSLRAAGYRVVRIWESALKKNRERCLKRVVLAMERARESERTSARKGRSGIAKTASRPNRPSAADV